MEGEVINAKSATHAAVFAQLYTPDGKLHGLHCFVVPIRDPKTMLPYPGVIIGDIESSPGEKNLDSMAWITATCNKMMTTDQSVAVNYKSTNLSRDIMFEIGLYSILLDAITIRTQAPKLLGYKDYPTIMVYFPMAKKSFVENASESKVVSTSVQGSSKMSKSIDDKATATEPDEQDYVSNYTIDADISFKKDDGTAPLEYHQQRSFKLKSKSKRRRCLCCRRRRKSDLDDTSLLRSYSQRGVLVHGSKSSEGMGSTDSEDEQDCFGGEFDPISITVLVRSKNQSRRARIPNRPDVSSSLWAVIKNAIGKDLTKLPLPVNFNEPLSMLQRLTEGFEYSHLLDKAAVSTDPFEQIAYIAAFTVSGYATSAVRTGKPFNPLLGETFECDRAEDLGWRCISEQVSHHPPLVAQHCQGRRWTCWQQFTMSSKFKGNSIEIVPLGVAHLLFPKTGRHYTWRKVPSIVHNVMIGKLWIDHEGEMDIFNHSTGETCHLQFLASSYFRGDANRVEGTIFDSNKQPKALMSGYWDSKMEMLEITKVDSQGRFTLGPPKLLWTRTPPPSDCDRYYNFTVLACQLNEMEEGCPPTDSRHRPDQRLMENGYFDEANVEKLRLEEKQRTNRRLRLAKSTYSNMSKKEQEEQDDGDDAGDREIGYTPAWFTLTRDKVTGKMTHVFNGAYWNCKRIQDWSRCADIY